MTLCLAALAGMGACRSASEPPVVAPPPVVVASPDPRPAQPIVPRRGPFAPSPVTPLAEAVVRVVRAAVRGDTLPDSAFLPPASARPGGAGDADLGDTPAAVVGDAAEILAFWIELDVGVAGEVAAGDQEATWHLTVLLTADALKIADVRARDARVHLPLPPWLEGIADVTRTLADEARAGALGGRIVGEAERPLFGEELFAKVRREVPGQEKLAQIEGLLTAHPRLVGYTLDEMGLLGRGTDGALYLYRLDLHDTVVDGPPWVRVRPFQL